MRILFDSNIQNTTITASPSNINYPVTNLKSQFLRKRYRASDLEAEITITLDEAISMDSFFYGYQNAYEMEVKLYNSSDALLQTLTLFDIPGYNEFDGAFLLAENGDELLTEAGDNIVVEVNGVGEELKETGRVYFAQEDNVKKIVITATSVDNNFFIGGADFGIVYTAPRGVGGGYTDGHLDNSVFSQSPGGQNLQNYIEPLKIREYNLLQYSLSEKKELEELYKSKGIGRNMYFDVFYNEQDHDGVLYGFIVDPLSFSRVPRIFNTRLVVREAR